MSKRVSYRSLDDIFCISAVRLRVLPVRNALVGSERRRRIARLPAISVLRSSWWLFTV